MTTPSLDSGTSKRARPRKRGGAALAILVGLSGIAGASALGPGAAAAPTAVGADVPAVVAPPGVPPDSELHPVTITADQVRSVPTPEQMGNARTIVEVGRNLGLPPRAWVIAVATALQESGLHNLGHLGARNDHDSLGLFQQRPSTGWGTPEQITDPIYAATAFYSHLMRVRDWLVLPLTVAAQKVQISAYPDRYARHESQAGDIVRAMFGVGPYAGVS
jgi:hypothetical protein